MIVNLLSVLTNDDSSLYLAANRLMVMSDYEYIELAYLLRKIIRECSYDTELGEISLRGFNIMGCYDCELLVPLSKLISQKPYENVEDAKKRLEVTYPSHKKGEEESHEN